MNCPHRQQQSSAVEYLTKDLTRQRRRAKRHRQRFRGSTFTSKVAFAIYIDREQQTAGFFIHLFMNQSKAVFTRPMMTRIESRYNTPNEGTGVDAAEHYFFKDPSLH